MISLRSTDGIINLRLLQGTSQEALLDFDDGGALWLLGLPVTESNLQDKYKCHLRVILLQPESRI